MLIFKHLFLFKEIQHKQDEAFGIINLYGDETYDDPPYDLQSKEVVDIDIIDFIQMAMANFTFQMKNAIDQEKASQEKM